MTRPTKSETKRPLISRDVQPEVRRRPRLAAAKRDLTISDRILALTAQSDPGLAALWENRKDAQYDRL